VLDTVAHKQVPKFRLVFDVDDQLMQQIEQYQAEHDGMPRAQALRELVIAGLKAGGRG
jgi:hypothetical protein